MSKWDELKTEYPLNEKIVEIKIIISTIEEDSELDSEDIENLERIKQVTNYVEKRINELDPIFLNKSILNNLNSHLSSVFTELNNYNSNNNKTHLNNANNQIDNVLIQISNIPVIKESDVTESYTESLSSFRKSVGQYLRHIENLYRQLKKMINPLAQPFSGKTLLKLEKVNRIIHDRTSFRQNTLNINTTNYIILCNNKLHHICLS